MKHFIKRLLSLLICASLLFTLTIFFPVSALSSNSVTPAVSVGNAFTVALNAQGTIFAWGDNTLGQLGEGCLGAYSATPVQISVSGVTFQAVSAGFDHALALSADGKVYAWGNNENGQLGNDNYTVHTEPTLVSALQSERIVSISAGKRYSLALTEDGRVFAFGLNDKYQLGTDENSENPVPAAIAALSDAFITKIEAGESSAVAIDADGHAYVWGKAENYLLGLDGNKLLPTRLPDSKTTQQILQAAIGELSSAYLLADGTIGLMGKNQYGQYGTGETSSSASMRFKVTDTAALNVIALASANCQTVLLGTTGKVYTAGTVIGSDDSNEKNLTFTAFFDGQDSAPQASAIDAGYNNGAFIAQDGSVWMWGDNAFGQLGNGTQTASPTPVRVCGAENAEFTLGGAPHVQQMQLMFSTSIPSPDYAVTIPSTIDVGELRQTTTQDPERYSNTQFTVAVSNVQNLFGEQKIVLTVSHATGDSGFYLSDPSGTTLPYSLHLSKDAVEALANGDTLAEFTEDGSVSAWIRIDQSQILKSGLYSGTLVFDYSAKPIATGGAA